MNHILSNEYLTIEVSPHGAELQSIRNNRTGHEYLWQGNPAFWGRRSPVLFPIVGSLWNGEYHTGGNTYKMSQHGFARDMDFTIVEETETTLRFKLDSTPETLAAFPFCFSLEISYELNETRLEVGWMVKNLSETVMPFQIGAHPAFNYPDFSTADTIHGYFSLGGNTETRYELIESAGCLGNAMHNLATDAESMLPLTDRTFSHDALVIGNNQVHRVSLLTPVRTPYLTLLFRAPVLGLWSKPGAPFVCIEPWWGRCDRVGFDGDASTREYINLLDPRKTFKAGYYILIDNI